MANLTVRAALYVYVPEEECLPGPEVSLSGPALILLIPKLHSDQLNMAGCFWYLVKSNLSTVRLRTRVLWISQFL